MLQDLKKWLIVTESLTIIEQSDSKRWCNAYMKNALARGSAPGYLSVMSRVQFKREAMSLLCL